MSPAVANTLIVMPALNEEESIITVIRAVQKALPSAGLLVVDDGSTDATAAIAAAAGARVVSLPFNLGVGGAMRLGFRYALENGYHNVVQIDSDGQHDPEEVRNLLKKLEKYDLVIGARFAGSGNYSVSGPRKWAMKVLSAVLSRTTKAELTDTTSGFKASGPRAVKVFADHYPAEYLGDTVEALVIAARAGLTITQVPVHMRERIAGTPSHNPFKSAIYLGRACLALLFALLRPPVVHVKEFDS